MIYPYTAALHTVMAALCLASLVYLFYRKQDAQSPTLKAYFNWFLFFFIYNLLLIAPLVIYDELNFKTGLFYNLAIVSLALGMWQAMHAALHLVVTDAARRRFLSFLYLSGILLAAALHFVFPQLPQGSPERDWIFWYPGQKIALFYTLFAFVAGWTFGYSNLRGFRYLTSGFLKVRALFFAFAGFIMPFAAFYYFGATRVSHIVLAFIISILGLICFIAGNIIIGLLRKISS